MHMLIMERLVYCNRFCNEMIIHVGQPFECLIASSLQGITGLVLWQIR